MTRWLDHVGVPRDETSSSWSRTLEETSEWRLGRYSRQPRFIALLCTNRSLKALSKKTVDSIKHRP